MSELVPRLEPRGTRVLVVEDHLDLAANLCDYLEARGWLPEHACDGSIAIRLATQYDYDVVVLDLTLPRVDGLDVARALQQHGGPPILMLTARDALDDRLEGFAAGADDYLVKPFAMRELAARLQALMRRRRRSREHLAVGDLVMDASRAEARIQDRVLALSKTELQVLTALAASAPDLVRREALERQLWGEEPPESGALRTHVYRLRKELDAKDSSLVITTVRGVGYRIDQADDPKAPGRAPS